MNGTSSAVSFPSSVAVPTDAKEVAFTATGAFFVGTSQSVTVTATYFRSTQSASLTVVGEDKVDKEVAIAKEIEVESQTLQRSSAEGTETTEEKPPGESTEKSDSSTGEEVQEPASGRSFVQPAEQDLPGQEALDQPPAQEEVKSERKEEKPRARRGRKKKRPEG